MSEMIYGIHAIESFLKKTPERLREVFICHKQKNKHFLSLIQALKNQKVIIHLTDRRNLDKRSKNAIHQGIIAYVKPTLYRHENDLLDIVSQKDNPFLLILDNVTDPHNLGACLRSAEAAGIHAVIIPKNRSSQLNATVRKIACGAAENIPLIRVTNLVRTIRSLRERNIWIIGTDSEANRTIYQITMTKRIALVLGSEDKGIRYLTRKYCNELISIPMAGSISSLNVSVATGICLFEVMHHRNC